jgi:hypothetical protein
MECPGHINVTDKLSRNGEAKHNTDMYTEMRTWTDTCRQLADKVLMQELCPWEPKMDVKQAGFMLDYERGERIWSCSERLSEAQACMGLVKQCFSYVLPCILSCYAEVMPLLNSVDRIAR